MSPSSLSLAFKKQYVRVFDGKGSWKKRIAGAALIFGTPFIIPEAGVDTLSAERTPDLGDRQVQALQADIGRMGADAEKIRAEYHAAYTLSQLQLTEPKNAALAQRAKEAQENYSRGRARLNSDVQDFRDRLTLSQGISEVDAVSLVQKAADATGYNLYPKREGSWQMQMRYLDECQGEEIKTGLAQQGGPQAKQVSVCQDKKLSTDYSWGFAFGIAGMLGMGLSLTFLSALGDTTRNRLPEHEKRLQRETAARTEKKKEITIKIRQGK